jgi:hypothetical protein
VELGDKTAFAGELAVSNGDMRSVKKEKNK